MPFEIKVDADGALRQFDELQQNIADLEHKLPDTFLLWQREDMHRHFPKLVGGGMSVSTEIFPRSRLPRKNKQSGGKSTRRRAHIAAHRPGASTKPILRPELFDRLCARMVEMLKEAAKWP